MHSQSDKIGHHAASLSTFLASAAELLAVALAAAAATAAVAVFLRDEAAAGLAAAAAGGRPTGRPVDLAGCLASGCLAVVVCLAAAARGRFSTATGLSTAGFAAAGVLVRSFLGDGGGDSSTPSTGSADDCTANMHATTDKHRMLTKLQDLCKSVLLV